MLSSTMVASSENARMNKCSGRPEISVAEIEKLKAILPFQREDFSFPKSDSPDQGKEKSSNGKGRGRELFLSHTYLFHFFYLSNVMTPTKIL